MSIVRFGVSMEKELLDALDHYALKNSFPNRSQAIRHLISENTVQEKWIKTKKWQEPLPSCTTTTNSQISHTLNHIQHDYHSIILSNLHFHIDHHNCMEIIAVKGRAGVLRELAEKIISTKGIEHGKLTMTH